MKNLKYLVIYPLIGTLLFFGCAKKERIVTTANKQEIKKITPIGKTAAKQLLSTLKKELLSAIEAEGLVSAITVCNVKAPVLTQEISKKSDKIIDIKRTSFKYRNPANAPDELDSQALKFFEDFLRTNDSLPSFQIQKIEERDKTYFRYYQPLTIAPLCLNCHGEKQNMDEAVLAVIDEKYPADKATGYHLDDFRGVVRVTVE